MIAYRSRNNISLKHKLVRAKLKPIDKTNDSEATQPDQITPKTTQELHVPIDYPYTIFKSSLQNFKNPIRCCCHACVICPLIETRCFAESTTLEQKYPIMLQHPKQFFNCKPKLLLYYTLSYAQHPAVEHNTWATPPGVSRVEYSNT